MCLKTSEYRSANQKQRQRLGYIPEKAHGLQYGEMDFYSGYTFYTSVTFLIVTAGRLLV